MGWSSIAQPFIRSGPGGRVGGNGDGRGGARYKKRRDGEVSFTGVGVCGIRDSLVVGPGWEYSCTPYFLSRDLDLPMAWATSTYVGGWWLPSKPPITGRRAPPRRGPWIARIDHIPATDGSSAKGGPERTGRNDDEGCDDGRASMETPPQFLGGAFRKCAGDECGTVTVLYYILVGGM